MKDIGEGTIRKIDWTELTPVVLLLRVFNISLGVRILFIALIGLQMNLWLNVWTGISFLNPALTEQAHLGKPLFYVNIPVDLIYFGVVDVINTPNVLWLSGVLLIWTICGGMICRIVVVRLTIDESESMGNLLLFLRKRGISFITAPLLMSLGILCCFLPVKIAGWLLAVPYLNYIVAIFFPIPFFFACLTVFLTVMLAAGFMLLFAAVSADGSDGFDAISRMFSYVYQRPLHYVFYWLCCGVLGYLGFLLIQFVIIHPAIEMCWRADSVNVAVTEIKNEDIASGILLSVESKETLAAPVGNEEKRSKDRDAVSALMRFWAYLFALIPRAFVLAWFWTSSVAIYLLLRRSVDATPFNEVYRVAPPKVRSLPMIKPDDHGAPEIVLPVDPNA